MSYRIMLAKEKARNLYNTGKYTNKAVAKKVGVTEKALQNWIKNDGWKIGLIRLAQFEGLKAILEDYNEHIAETLTYNPSALKRALKLFLTEKTITY